MPTLNPGLAYWEQRQVLRQMRPRIEALSAAVDFSGDFSLSQWAQISALSMTFEPDLVLELGRGAGNSTAAFLEVANRLGVQGKPCRVVSICMTNTWEEVTLPRLKKICGPEWFEPLTAICGDILHQDYERLLENSNRVALFWDAHGFEVAGCVLGEILPRVAPLEHVVLMHDLSDQRYLDPSCNSYGDNEIWSGVNDGTARMVLGNINSGVAQAISVLDFASRNGIELDSGDHSIQREIGADPAKIEEMRTVLGNELFQLLGCWFWFTVSGHSGPLHFPKFRRPTVGTPT